MSYLKVVDIYKNFDVKAMAQLKGISFSLNRGEVISIIGPSGTGKSTLLNIISNDSAPDQGSVELEGKKVENGDIAYLKSSFDLDFKLDVISNIISGLSSDVPHPDAIDMARDMIEVFGLEYKDKKSLDQLSAGQLQRVRLAKAMIKMPSLILLDEPFTNLDEFLKKEILSELLEFIREKQITTILVTHHLQEAFSLSDRVMILAHGKVLQFDTPEKIYQNPVDVFSARFGGDINLIASNVLKIDGENVVVKGPYGEFTIRGHADSKKFIYHAIRPENVLVSDKGSARGKIVKRTFFGEYYLYAVNTGEKNPVLLKSNEKYDIGSSLSLDLSNRSFLIPI